MRAGLAVLAVIIALLTITPSNGAEQQKTYKLTIGDTSVEINPGESLDVTLPDGRTTKVTLELNAFATYSGATFSFVHPTNVSVAKSQLDTDISQHLAATALGTIVIVQEYSSMNPTKLNDLMLQELTKESVQAGGELTQEAATRKLSDGKELAGLKATVRTRTEESHYEVFSFGADDQGLVLVTRIDRDNIAAEGALIDKFWESLTITPL